MTMRKLTFVSTLLYASTDNFKSSAESIMRSFPAKNVLTTFPKHNQPMTHAKQ